MTAEGIEPRDVESSIGVDRTEDQRIVFESGLMLTLTNVRES